MSPAVATPPVGPTPVPAAVPTPVPSVPGYFARLKRFTVAEYHELIRLGIVSEKERTELIEGYVVNVMGINPPHSTTVNRLRKLLDRLLPAGWDSRIQDVVTLADSEPLPDYVIVRGSDADYATRHPGPTDIGLLVEVADSSVAVDRADSQRIYARAGIPVYWIVNVPDRQIEVYTDPQPAANPPVYGTRNTFGSGADVPVILGGVFVGTVAVVGVLP